MPDDSLEDYVRQVGHLPERMEDTRDIDEEREGLQNRNQPPEPKTAAGEDDEDISDEVIEEAKKRLGR